MNLAEVSWLTVFLACILIVAALNDLRFQKIPNLLTYPTMIISLAYYGATVGFRGVLFSIAGLAAGLAILIVFYLLGGMGAGDVKLMGAAGAVLGPRGVLNAFVATAIIGGIYALLLMVFRFRYCREFISRCAMMLKTFASTGAFMYVPATEHEKKPRLYYGIAIAFGTLFTIWWELSNHSFPL